MNNTYRWPRIIVVVSSLLLAFALFLPIWRIELDAPQYPEGLILKIFANGLQGDVNIINGLNHYIGMKELQTSDFIEFTILPYIIGSLVVLGLVTAAVNRKGAYYSYIAIFMAVAIISMVDFYRWEYNYGHNLNPHAAIQIPGMTYQPPLIGFKQLLNFGAYSIPDVGGICFILSGVLLLVGYILILKPKWIPMKKFKPGYAAVILVIIFQSCSTGPRSIKYGLAACDFCKMTIMDKRFACQFVTEKGKAYSFDDVHCMQSFMKASRSKGIAYVNDFTGKQELAKADQLFFVHAEGIPTPMGGNILTFVSEQDRDKAVSTNTGKALSWKELQGEPVK
jgi:copper chaperone NosL